MLSKDILLKCRTNDDRYSSAGVCGLCVGIFSSLQGWLCVGVLCALQCAKNCVGSSRQSHGCLYLCRMFNRVTYNGLRIGDGGAFEKHQFSIYTMPNGITNVEFTTVSPNIANTMLYVAHAIEIYK